MPMTKEYKIEPIYCLRLNSKQYVTISDEVTGLAYVFAHPSQIDF